MSSTKELTPKKARQTKDEPNEVRVKPNLASCLMQHQRVHVPCDILARASLSPTHPHVTKQLIISIEGHVTAVISTRKDLPTDLGMLLQIGLALVHLSTIDIDANESPFVTVLSVVRQHGLVFEG